MHIHILGICGTFMGGLAALAREAGHRVSGCDANVYPPMSTQLEQLGIALIDGYDPAQADLLPDMFVVGNAVSRGNPLLEEILKNDPDTHDFLVHFNKFGDFSLNLDVVYWCRKNDFREYTRVFQRINLTIKERFDAEGLSFAFPTQTIQVENSRPSPMTVSDRPATTR